MRAVIQRARDAEVIVDGTVTGSFSGAGVLMLVGVTHGDSVELAVRLADKAYDLRVFGPEHAPADGARTDPGATPARELSASDLGLPLLVVSQFTLYGETHKGRRPTWDAAAPAAVAEPLVAAVVERLRERGAVVATGVFGADMQVRFTNDGPVTLVIDV